MWKEINGYEKLYEVSDGGEVRSLDRVIKNRSLKGKILSPTTVGDGYLQVTLFKSGKRRSFLVHLLVFDHFKTDKRNGRILQVDHIDNNKKNNKVANLQLLSNRSNNLKKIKPHTSKYKGVYFNKQNNKYGSCICINGKSNFLGYFDNEESAYEQYLLRLNSIQNGTEK